MNALQLHIAQHIHQAKQAGYVHTAAAMHAILENERKQKPLNEEMERYNDYGRTAVAPLSYNNVE